MSAIVNNRSRVGTFLLGMLLLILGVLLLISRAGVVDLNFTRIIAFTVLAAGGIEAITAFASTERRRLFWGAVLFLTALLVLLASYDFIPDSWGQIWPSVLLIPGLAFLMVYFSDPKEYSLIIIAGLFVLFGWAGLMAVQGDLDVSGGALGMLRFLVPAAVVIAGFYVIWRNFFRTRT
ncbi:MAG: hypothetical protein M1469_11445 [Bacteroidetes bacterium]|nr:hypothetical protein [Bacteroidota bacterium]